MLKLERTLSDEHILKNDAYSRGKRYTNDSQQQGQHTQASVNNDLFAPSLWLGVGGRSQKFY